ncbi:MAG TPA: amidohydrolase family protein [Gemmatimonadaceae bacterium]|nr:amidohydrolase family protein [Gemmatimonadaceae bacterium]
MRRYTRGEFLSLSAMLAGAVGLTKVPFGKLNAQPPTPLPQRGAGIEADLVVINARVLTMDPALPRAEAFAVKDGRFLAIGSTVDIRNVATPRTRVIDAAGMCVVPGFIDAHCHPSGVNELFGVVVTQLKTKAELIEALRKKAASTPPGFWVEGELFDDTKLTDPAPLDRHDLDKASTVHPIEVNHRGGHTSWYNSKALELAGITRNTPDPEHGRFFRDASGELTGRAAEAARGALGGAGKHEQFTPEQHRDRARQGMKHISGLLTATGLTTVHDAGAGADRIRAYEDARANGELKHRAYMMLRGAYQQLRSAGIYTGFGDEWIRVGGVKYGADGSASERTMRMSTPYVGTNDYGILTMTQQEIHEAVEDAHRNRWQVGIHANGDVTIDMVLQAYERVQKQWPHPDRRHRIEHCSLVNPSLLQRIKAAGVIPTPFWTYVYYHGEKWSQYGDEKMRWMFAHRSFLDHGIPVAGASDYGPGPFEPLMALQSMVTRRDYRGREWGPNQKVTIDEALRIATVNGAYASYEEKVKGSISTGKYADFVVLEKDPHDVDPNTIKDIRVVHTVVGGTMAHSVA